MGTNVAGLDLGFNLPTFSTAGIGYWITVLGIIFLMMVILCIGLFIWYQRKIFYIQIRDFENIAGKGYQCTFKDTARLIKIGDGGEEVIFLKKRKQYRTAYGQKMGTNEYWFAKGQDGYWYNTVLGDLDAKMGMLDIEPIDRDMRYMHVAIRKNIQDRYKKHDWMEKYGQIVISFVFLLIMIVAVWILVSKVGDLIQLTQPLAQAQLEAAKALTNAVSHLDTLCSGGTGLRAA